MCRCLRMRCLRVNASREASRFVGRITRLHISHGPSSAVVNARTSRPSISPSPLTSARQALPAPNSALTNGATSARMIRRRRSRGAGGAAEIQRLMSSQPATLLAVASTGTGSARVPSPSRSKASAGSAWRRRHRSRAMEMQANNSASRGPRNSVRFKVRGAWFSLSPPR
jgi:hypothetical protein